MTRTQTPARPAAEGSAITGRATLVTVSRGPNAGARYLLDTDVAEIGRHPDADIYLDDITVTRRHAQFRRTATGVQVTDLGSLNGTYVNQERVHTAPIEAGDEIQIGRFRLTVRYADETDVIPAPAPAAATPPGQRIAVHDP